MAHYAELPKNQMAIVEPLIQNAAFMKITLDDLQKSINADGCSEEYMNGANQYGKKPAPICKPTTASSRTTTP